MTIAQFKVNSEVQQLKIISLCTNITALIIILL